MLSLRLARGSHPLVLLRRAVLACASAGVGFLLLAALGRASLPELLWCAAPLLATVQFAVAVARTEPHARPAPGLASAGFGPAAAPAVGAASTAMSCILGSALALLLFLVLRGELGGLPFDGAAAALLGAGGPLPLAGALLLLALLPAVAAAASAVSLRARGAVPGSEAEAARARARARARRRANGTPPGAVAMANGGVPGGGDPGGSPGGSHGGSPGGGGPGSNLATPVDLPWGAALAATGVALGGYAAQFAGAGTDARTKLALPAGSGEAAPAVVAGWALLAVGLVLAGPGIVHLCGRLLCLARPGALRLLAGRVLQEEARRVGRPLGALCAVLAGAVVYAVLQRSGDVGLRRLVIGEQLRVARRHRGVPVDADVWWAQKVPAAAVDPGLVGPRLNHGRDLLASAHGTGVHVVHAVRCPQVGDRFGVTAVDRRAVCVHQLQDRQVVLE